MRVIRKKRKNHKVTETGKQVTGKVKAAAKSEAKVRTKNKTNKSLNRRNQLIAITKIRIRDIEQKEWSYYMI